MSTKQSLIKGGWLCNVSLGRHAYNNALSFNTCPRQSLKLRTLSGVVIFAYMPRSMKWMEPNGRVREDTPLAV
eukprot:4724326-Amphidinium_carterae.1